MSEVKKVDICIATYHRPFLLSKLIKSLLEQQVDAVVYRIVVIDNDVNGSAKSAVEDINHGSEVEMVYDVVSEQNISLVRNRAIELAEGDYIVFIDDDEYAEPDWLQNLLDARDHWQADVVFGPVVAVYPEDAPAWVVRGRFFDRVRWESGSIRFHGGTGNVLVCQKTINKMRKHFDPEFGLSGGGDTEFFHRLNATGAKMVWCDSAVVYEIVPLSRMTIRWLVLRAFRGGQVHSRIYVAHVGFLRRIPWAMKRLSYFVVAALFLPFSWLGGKSVFVKTLQKMFANMGQLTGHSRFRYNEYKRL